MGCTRDDGPFDDTDGSILSDPLDGGEPDRDDGEVEQPDDTGSDPDAGPQLPCERDEDCDDGLACNGVERCLTSDDEPSVCGPGDAPECPAEHPCREETQGCDCSVPDNDGDHVPATVCLTSEEEGEGDCDDTNDKIFPKAPEECDPADVDEDCNPSTFHAPGAAGLKGGDRDRDGYIGEECGNFDARLGERIHGDDCDDTNDAVHPRNSEVCNYIDDNCDGLVDELAVEGADGPIELGLRAKLYPDFDQDQYANMEAPPRLECDFRIPPGYVFATAHDCDDRPLRGARTHPNAPEICDNADNDCDGEIDEKDGMTPRYDFESTELACVDGAWIITTCPSGKLWCDGDPIEQGCRTDGTKLTSCGACNTDCQFSCGSGGCDEIAEIAAGGAHACARTDQGRVACWGHGALGRLGDDGTVSRSVPTAVVTIESVHKVALGSDHTCAVLGEAHALACWGSNADGKLGSDTDVPVGSFTSRAVLVNAGNISFETESVATELIDVEDVALGVEHACAVLRSGHLTCWGQQSSGRLANGFANESAIAVPDVGIDAQGQTITNAASVTVGRLHGCILTTADEVECWGDNTFGQLGHDPQTLSASPVALRVPELRDVRALSAGGFHTCALTDQGVYCWGDNRRLQLGDRPRGSSDPDYLPRRLPSLSNVTSLATGRVHTCAISQDGSIQCWGANHRGELGTSDLLDTAKPVRVALNDPSAVPTRVVPGGEFTCALTTDKRAFCWGDNAYGQLGRARTDFGPQPTPAAVRSLDR